MGTTNLTDRVREFPRVSDQVLAVTHPAAQHVLVQPQILGGLAYRLFPLLGQRYRFGLEFLCINSSFLVFLSQSSSLLTVVLRAFLCVQQMG